jgi:uncharacterized protein YecE (DUF72 family)
MLHRIAETRTKDGSDGIFIAATSADSYKEWKGSFLSEKLSAKDIFRTTSSKLPAVDLNNTFYRFTATHMVESWKVAGAGELRLSVKASQRITHFKRLKEAAERNEVHARHGFGARGSSGRRAVSTAAEHEERSRASRDVSQASAGESPAAFEFRHPTWFDDDVSSCCAARTARCVSQTQTICQPANRQNS